jgi:hypothetical protein
MDSFYSFDDGSVGSVRPASNVIATEMEIHPHMDPANQGGGQKEHFEIPEDEEDNKVPFIIKTRNPEGQSADGSDVIDTTILRISVNGGEAIAVGQKKKFFDKNFNIKFDLENIVKIYAEVKVTKVGESYTQAEEPKIKYYEAKEADPNGVNYAFVKEEGTTYMRQMIGTVEVKELKNYDVNSSRKFFKVVINQIIGGEFSFGPSGGTQTDANGVDTRASLKEMLICVNDKLYNMEVDVVRLEAASGAGGTP